MVPRKAPRMKLLHPQTGKTGFTGRINGESTILGLMANHKDLGQTPRGGLGG